MSLTPTGLTAVDLAVLASYEEAQIEGEPDFVVELIDLYLEEVPRLFDSLHTAIQNNDSTTAKRAAHSLRGSSGNLGVLQTAALAGELEQLANPCGTSATQLLQSLESEFQRVQEILSAERQRRSR
ncbi:MAG TPA: Hpt domain-containing protein [Pyrinomonadaceae bacterium]|jgi:HPt (histidine-containing phosphotransfer) domain-containing protein|nr:Hpt domain-containing protein [Pyrinomonadaceae bacterium]